MLGSNSSSCPLGFFPLDYEKACRRAAEQVVPNKPYGGSLSGVDLKAAYMAGCYWHTVDGSVYFNAEVASAAASVDSFALQLCAGAPIPPAPWYAAHAAEHDTQQGLIGRRAAFSAGVCDVRHACAAVCMPDIAWMPAYLPKCVRASERVCVYGCIAACVRSSHPPARPFIHRVIYPSIDRLKCSSIPSI